MEGNFRRYGVPLDGVRFLVGWFSETLPTAPMERLALLRMDGDMYESTWDALHNLYPRLSPGGYAIADDYYLLRGTRAAVDDYRAQNGITQPIVDIDGQGAYWRRDSEPAGGASRAPIAIRGLRFSAVWADRLQRWRRSDSSD